MKPEGSLPHKCPQTPLSWASSIHSIPPYPTSWRFILILYSHICLVLPSGPFPLGFPTKILYTPLLSSINATCPAHLILDFITRTIFGERYRSLSSSICSFLLSPVASYPLGPNTLSTPYSVTDQVSHPYKTTCKITVLYILIFIFLYN
jgi:hypothetical protein